MCCRWAKEEGVCVRFKFSVGGKNRIRRKTGNKNTKNTGSRGRKKFFKHIASFAKKGTPCNFPGAHRLQSFLVHYPEIHKHASNITAFDLRLDDRITTKEPAGQQ